MDEVTLAGANLKNMQTTNNLRIIQRNTSCKPRRTSVSVFSPDRKLLASDGNYKDIFDLGCGVNPKSLQEVIDARLEAGWISLSEAIDRRMSSETRISEMSAISSLQTLASSPDGQIVQLAHHHDVSSNKTFVFASETNYRSNTESLANNSQLPFHLLLANGYHVTSKLADLQDEKSDCPSHLISQAIFANSGELLYHLAMVPDLKSRFEIRSIDDLGIDQTEMDKMLISHGVFLTINSRLFADFDVLLRFEKRFTFEGGPSYIKCSFEKLGARFSCTRISTFFPHFTKREVKIVMLLAQGYNIKQIAHIVDRAQGTITIQARSAMQKSGTHSLVALVSLVCQVCVWE